MTIKLDRNQRDALHAACLLDLTAMDEIELYMREGDFDEARALTSRAAGTAELLDDLGWSPETPGDEFVLHGDLARLRAVVARLRAQAEDSLRDQAVWMAAGTAARHLSGDEPTEEWWAEEVQRSVDEDLDTRLVCDRILEIIDRDALAVACSHNN